MKILAIESSAKSASVAVAEDGQLAAYAYQNVGLTHSRTLMPMLENMLKSSELSLADMDALAVAVGPGSFTGLRIGISTVKGLAFAAGKPCRAVSTLLAMATPLAHLSDTLIVCAMDARREQIYHALFHAKDGRLSRLCDDEAISLSDAADRLEREEGLRGLNKVVVGDGAELCCEYLLKRNIACTPAPPVLLRQSAAGVALAAENMPDISAEALRPFYLRPPQAERLLSAGLLQKPQK